MRFHANVFSLDTLGIVFPILAIVGSIFTFVYSIKFIMYISLVNINRMLYLKAHEASILMLLSPIILAVLVVVFVIPWIINATIVEPATTAISGMSNVNAEFHLFHGITPHLFQH